MSEETTIPADSLKQRQIVLQILLPERQPMTVIGETCEVQGNLLMVKRGKIVAAVFNLPMVQGVLMEERYV